MAAPQPPTGMAGLYGGVGPNAYVNNLYAPQEQALARQQQARVGTLQNLVQSILANLGRPQPDVYGAAAHDAVSAANGAAQTLQRVNPNASTQAMLQAIGAPQSQQDQVGQQNANTFTGGAALDQYLGGALPAGVFAQDQAARQTYLHSLPATVGLAAIQGLGHLNLMASQENSQLSSQKTQAQHTALTDLANYVQRNQAARAAAQKTAFDQSLATAKYRTGVDEFNTTSKYNYQKMAQDAYQSDRSYQISLASLGIKQRAQQIAALATEAKLKNGGFTPGQVQKYTGLAATLADNAKNGFTANNGKAYPPVNYQQAMREARKEGIPVSIAQAELNKLYQPGQQGRPLINNGAAPPFNFSGSSFPGVGSSPLAPGGVAAAAKSFLGVPYQWGGTNAKSGLDCSAFLQQVYAKMGIKVARTTYAQVKQGRPVPLGQLQAGDAIFTEPGKNGPNHVGLYLGNGQVQESPHTGDVNKIISLTDFLSGGFVAARRYG